MWNSSGALLNSRVREQHPNIFLGTQTWANAQSVVSVIGNFIVMFLTVRSPALRSKPHNYFIFALALSDFTFSLAVTTSSIGILVRNEELCSFGGTMIWIWGLASFGFPAILSINRYVAIYYNHHYDRWFSRWRVITYISLNFLTTSAITLPYPLLGAMWPDPSYVFVCGPQTPTLSLSVAYNLSGNAYFLLTYGLVLWFNWKCIAKLKESQNNTSGLRSPVIEESRKLIKMMIIVAVLPIPLQWPCILSKMIGDLTKAPNPVVGMLTACAYPLPSTINPFITLSVVLPYRKALQALLRGRNLNGANGMATSTAPVTKF